MTVISTWWRLNIRFKDPVGDRMGVELLFNSVEFGSQSSCQQTSRELETRCGRESCTRPRGLSESPDGVDPNIRRTRKTQRDGHNSGVKIWSLCSVSVQHPLTCKPWTTLSNPCNKKRGKYICKEVSCVFLLALCFCELFYIYMCMYVDVTLHMWLYNIISLLHFSFFLSNTLLLYRK